MALAAPPAVEEDLALYFTGPAMQAIGLAKGIVAWPPAVEADVLLYLIGPLCRRCAWRKVLLRSVFAPLIKPLLYFN
jgi:hypothetical protein